MIIENAANSNRHNKERWFSDLRQTCVSPSLSPSLGVIHKVAIKPDAKPEDEHVSVSVCMCVHMYVSRQAARLVNERDDPLELRQRQRQRLVCTVVSLLCVALPLLLLLHSKWAKPKRAKKRASESGPMTHGQRVYWTSSSGNLNSYVSRQGRGRGGGDRNWLIWHCHRHRQRQRQRMCVCIEQEAKLAKWPSGQCCFPLLHLHKVRLWVSCGQAAGDGSTSSSTSSSSCLKAF